MDIYEYVALADEYGTRSICNKYGIDHSMVQTVGEMSECLQQAVAENGEPVMIDILNLHPDKEIILEVYGKEKKKACSCSDKANANDVVSSVASSFSSIKESHLFIFAGAMLIAAAIISK